MAHCRYYCRFLKDFEANLTSSRLMFQMTWINLNRLSHKLSNLHYRASAHTQKVLFQNTLNSRAIDVCCNSQRLFSFQTFFFPSHFISSLEWDGMDEWFRAISPSLKHKRNMRKRKTRRRRRKRRPCLCLCRQSGTGQWTSGTQMGILHSADTARRPQRPRGRTPGGLGGRSRN